MYIKFQSNTIINGKVETVWHVFRTSNIKYTDKIASKIRDYLTWNVHSDYKTLTINQIKDWHSTIYKIAKVTDNSGKDYKFEDLFIPSYKDVFKDSFVTVENSQSFDTKRVELVNVIDLDMFIK